MPKGAMVAGGNRLSPTEADSGDGDRFSGGGIQSPTEAAAETGFCTAKLKGIYAKFLKILILVIDIMQKMCYYI